ncbi:MAG TPA: 50S ribosomal protein L30 [Terriglobia bacterium]|nr:50S ribosomal protein L30 [Terriglobia bacterium]
MPNKAGTIHIKWVRSGIGFPRKQKEIVRSIGLKRLNQVVERPDTGHFRGLVAKVGHLVEIVGLADAPAWAGVPEYKLIPEEGISRKSTPAEKKAETAEGSTAEMPVAAKEDAVKEKGPQKEKGKDVTPAKKPAAAKGRATKPAGEKASAASEKPSAKRKPAVAKSGASDKKESKSMKGKK